MPDREGRWPQDHLKDLTGWLDADGHAELAQLYRRGASWKVPVSPTSGGISTTFTLPRGTGVAKEALERMAELYQIEASIRGDAPDRRRSVRQDHAAPLIDEVEAWLHSQLTQISGKSASAGAIDHGLTSLKQLRPNIDDGCLSIDSDAVERRMRSIAFGRNPESLLDRSADENGQPSPAR